jgi:hypothetical protein
MVENLVYTHELPAAWRLDSKIGFCHRSSVLGHDPFLHRTLEPRFRI